MLGWPWSRQLQLQTLCTVSSNASIPLGGEWGGGVKGNCKGGERDGSAGQEVEKRMRRTLGALQKAFR